MSVLDDAFEKWLSPPAVCFSTHCMLVLLASTGDEQAPQKILESTKQSIAASHLTYYKPVCDTVRFLLPKVVGNGKHRDLDKFIEMDKSFQASPNAAGVCSSAWVLGDDQNIGLEEVSWETETKPLHLQVIVIMEELSKTATSDPHPQQQGAISRTPRRSYYMPFVKQERQGRCQCPATKMIGKQFVHICSKDPKVTKVGLHFISFNLSIPIYRRFPWSPSMSHF